MFQVPGKHFNSQRRNSGVLQAESSTQTTVLESTKSLALTTVLVLLETSFWASAQLRRHLLVSHYFMVALWNRETIYIFMLWFILLSSFFSSPNLSRRRLDVCHSSTHGVALVRISDAGLKPAVRGSLKTQDAKKSPKIAI